MTRRKSRGRKNKALTRAAAISDDEQSDIGGDIIVPVKETRGKSRSVDIADDVSDTKSDLDIPKVTGDLNGSAAVANGDDDEDEDEDDDDLEADECVSRDR